jgi:hypothetical protein
MSYVRIRAVVVMIVWLLDLQLPLKSVPINTNVVSSNSAYGEVYSIRHYVIMFVSYLRQISDFLLVLWFPPNKTDYLNITEILLKVGLNIITQPICMDLPMGSVPPSSLMGLYSRMVKVIDFWRQGYHLRWAGVLTPTSSVNIPRHLH